MSSGGDDPQPLRRVDQTGSRKVVALVGGPDVGLRREMVVCLANHFEMHVFGSDPGSAELLPAQAHFHLYQLARGFSPLRDARTVVALRRMLLDLGPDVVHAYDSKPAALARIAAHWARVPVIIGTLPGLGSLYSDNRTTTRLIRRLYESVQRFASRISSLTILQNYEDLDELVRRRVISSERAAVVAGSGVDMSRFRPGRRSETAVRQLRSELGAMGDEHLVVMISRVIRSKGVMDLAVAASALRMRCPGRYVFVLVGRADEAGYMPFSAGELEDIQDDVKWLGERMDVANLLAAADTFVLPTYYREGIPRALLEAAATGLGLVATDTPGCREVVLDGQTGLLVPAHDPAAIAGAIMRLDNPALRAKLGGEARRLVGRRFAVETICQELTSLYLSTADRAAQPAGAR